MTTLYSNANLTNLASKYYTKYNAAEIAVTEMEDVLKNNYASIRSVPEHKKITQRGTYLVSVEVEKYSDEYMDRKDLIKTVTVNVKYTYQNKEEVYTISTLATK